MRAFQRHALILLAFQVMASALEDSPEKTNGFLLFLRQHFIPDYVPLEDVDCNHLMSGSILTTGKCKKANTYIVSFPDLLQAVCNSKGKPYNNLRKSLDRFDLITCTLEEDIAEELCNYKLRRFSDSIVVGCDRYGYPVHLEESYFQTAMEKEAKASRTWYNYFL
ncbi:angiogenin-like [Heteronotia binoei]|uniref:angiogenin-like n=1 Tax=Heteronotia binoei TaxID=13085 RepID=UPI0029316701|nr:angiogenin-like [Heteronotia binoei]